MPISYLNYELREFNEDIFVKIRVIRSLKQVDYSTLKSLNLGPFSSRVTVALMVGMSS